VKSAGQKVPNREEDQDRESEGGVVMKDLLISSLVREQAISRVTISEYMPQKTWEKKEIEGEGIQGKVHMGRGKRGEEKSTTRS